MASVHASYIYMLLLPPRCLLLPPRRLLLPPRRLLLPPRRFCFRLEKKNKQNRDKAIDAKIPILINKLLLIKKKQKLLRTPFGIVASLPTPPKVETSPPKLPSQLPPKLKGQFTAERQGYLILCVCLPLFPPRKKKQTKIETKQLTPNFQFYSTNEVTNTIPAIYNHKKPCVTSARIKKIRLEITISSNRRYGTRR